MIPGVILDFLANKATVAISGTRDANFIPHVHYVSAWRVEPDAQTICCAIPEAYTSNLISSLEDNGQFALTVEQIGSHETYQFKGEYIDNGPVQEDDMSAFEHTKQRFVDVVSTSFGVPEDLCRRYIAPPGIVIRFKVREIFLQTPGPGAGRRLTPPEEK